VSTLEGLSICALDLLGPRVQRREILNGGVGLSYGAVNGREMGAKQICLEEFEQNKYSPWFCSVQSSRYNLKVKWVTR
jgi:hypothetical protein